MYTIHKPGMINEKPKGDTQSIFFYAALEKPQEFRWHLINFGWIGLK